MDRLLRQWSSRYRQSLKTTAWREALQREKELVAQASQGKLAPRSQQFAQLAFSEAAERYLADRLRTWLRAAFRPNGAPNAVESLLRRNATDTNYSRFGSTVHRVPQECQCVEQMVNQELAIVRGILKRPKRLHLVAEEIRPLPIRHSVGRALRYEEEVRLVKTATSKPEWQVARLATTLALNTTMRGCEIKGLRWRGVDFIERTLTIRRSKTEAGARIIPLSVDAWAVILDLWERAKSFSGTDPRHFVFPACEGGRIDPAQPQRTWRTAWQQLTRGAGLGWTAVQRPQASRYYGAS